MCGIFAISTVEPKNVGETVLNGLKKLEYRGYDSWGIAVRNSEKIEIKKNIGKISEVSVQFEKSIEAIGHTRWATHGGVTKNNSHPHQVGKITLVHNGVCENFLEIKKQFPHHKFQSETDSEVIACLFNDFYEKLKNPKQAIIETVKKLEGRFAILIMFANEKNIFALRKGSPLIIGRSQNETFIASDIPAFLDKTNIVNYLDDNQLAEITGNVANFFDLQTGEKIEKRNIKVPYKIENIDKGDFPHFMIKEIFDQKESLARAINHDYKTILKSVELLQNANGSYLIACGTSHKVAMVAEYFFAKISGKKVNVVPASELYDFRRFINPKTCLIAISQSGETADIMEQIEFAKEKKAKILAITNVESSSLARIADVNLPLNAGTEKAVASTKAATSQMAIMFLLAFALSGDLENPNSVLQKINQAREILNTVVSGINDLLNPRYENHIREIAKKIYKTSNLFIIGRSEMFPIALESAIKIQEVSYISAMGFPAGELKHGPIALIEKGTPCLVLGDDAETISNAMELKSRGAKIIGVSSQNSEVFEEWMKVPNCDGAQAIVNIIPVQILAYHLAIFRGLNPDMPRNLAKSVTVK